MSDDLYQSNVANLRIRIRKAIALAIAIHRISLKILKTLTFDVTKVTDTATQ